MTKKLLFCGWITTIIFLFLYSFTQIDLGLTLTRVSFWQGIQRNFQQIGYFNRPLSTGLYLLILLLLFGFYFLLLRTVQKGKLKEKEIWKLILLTAGILWFAYNAFSYDLFNYIFWGKIITFYRQNPYRVRALDFPGDPMLGFMHWTHNLYPHGPGWLLFVIPFSFLSLQKLIPAMILIKGLAVAAYLLACWLIKKVLVEISPKQKLLGLTLFAFSPLVVIESLVSGHNDMVMMALSLLSFWLLFKRRYFWACVAFAFSVSIKFVTVLLLPVFLIVCWQRWRRNEVAWQKVWLVCVALMILALFLAAKRTNIQPWYLLYPLPFVSLLSQKRWLFWPAIGVSFGLLLNYVPFFYTGNWNPPIPMINLGLTLGFFGLSILLIKLSV